MDKLDKAIEDLTTQKDKDKKKKKFDPSTAMIPKSGGELLWADAQESPVAPKGIHDNLTYIEESPAVGILNTDPPESSTVTEPENVDTQDYKKEMYKNFVAVKDTYLPQVLCLLNLFTNNSDARVFIRKQGIILNGKLNHNCHATDKSSNFSIQFNGQEYQIFKV